MKGRVTMLLTDPTMVGYCTNVHAGQDLKTTQAQLEEHALAVRDQLEQSQLAVGLWLSRKTASQLLDQENSLPQFADWLAHKGLLPYTLNGFPYGDFHQEVVKHQVYQPTWAEPERLQYTIDLANILARLHQSSDHPTAGSGTISTLPIGWPSETPGVQQAAAEQFLKLTERLESIHEQQGTQIQVCIEPEPGCVLGDMRSALRFFEQFLLKRDKVVQDRVSRYLSICYDICHAAVMDECSEDNLMHLKQLGIGVGKVQVSSAISIDFEKLTDDTSRSQAWERLQSFQEPRYLHQTLVYRSDGSKTFYEDLPLALKDSQSFQTGRWVVHFHVPISEARFGAVNTTQAEITHFISACDHLGVKPIHWEVETYAWNVLPADLQRRSLAHGIADEIRTLQHWLGNG